MKKLLALVLALIMVLGLGVTAFALPVAKLNVIVLEEDDDDDDDDPKIIKTLDFNDEEEVYLCGPAGGDFYFEISKYNDLKNVTVSATGNVTAEIVEFDADTMRYPGADYGISVGDAIYTEETYQDGKDTKNMIKDSIGYVLANIPLYDLGITTTGDWKTQADFKFANGTDDIYSYYEYLAKKLNAGSKVKKNQFSVVCLKEVANTIGAGTHFEKLSKNLLKVTVDENYTAAYKEGTVKLEAYDKVEKEDVVADLTIISDVAIFEYEQVKWAAKEGEALVIYDKGYSDYLTAKNGYGDGEYNADALRYDEATVVSTTAFRAIEDKELTVAIDENNYVEIEEIVKGQKGVNFAWEGYTYYDKDDEELDFDEIEKGELKYITFGFLGNQVLNSDFTITVAPQIDYYQLRELFGKKVEEEDIITYYVLKDGVKIDEFTVDYKNDDVEENFELEILGKAGDKLGFYTLTLDAPAAAEEGEENPNTGAESVVGVVAAMAVISLATAAAVSLKK